LKFELSDAQQPANQEEDCHLYPAPNHDCNTQAQRYSRGCVRRASDWIWRIAPELLDGSTFISHPADSTTYKYLQIPSKSNVSSSITTIIGIIAGIKIPITTMIIAATSIMRIRGTTIMGSLIQVSS
jgi:hypothetical protein